MPHIQNTSCFFSFILLPQIFTVTSYSTTKSPFLFYISISFFIPKSSWDFMHLCYCLAWYLRPLLTSEGYVLFMNPSYSQIQTVSKFSSVLYLMQLQFLSGQRDKSQSNLTVFSVCSDRKGRNVM